MKHRILLFILSAFTFTVNAQSLSPKVIASCGGYFTGGGNSLSWTMGETFTTTLSSANNMLTQGFQQPNVSVVLLNMKAFLEGYYASGTSQLMNNSGAGGCLYLNNTSPNFNDVDTVFISMMNAITHAAVDTKSGILQTDGNVSVTFGPAVVAGTSYYIKVKHRNAMETWSASPVLAAAVTSYDFTTAQNKAYGNNMTITSDNLHWAFYSGDISDGGTGTIGIQDGIIESQDYSDEENAVNAVQTGYIPQDITGDLVAESLDYSIMENNVYFVIFVQQP